MPREIKLPAATDTHVVYGVFDLAAQSVRSCPGKHGAIFADVPGGPDDFSKLGSDIATAVIGRGLGKLTKAKGRVAKRR